MNGVKLERIKFLYTSGLVLRDVLSSLLSKRGEDQTRIKRITSLLNFTDLLCLELVNLAKDSCSQEAGQGKLEYTTATGALAFALEQLGFNLQELEAGKKRKKIRKRRSESRRKAKLGQPTGTANDAEAAITYSMKPDDIEKMYGFMDEAIKILRKGNKDCKPRAAQLSRQLMIWIRASVQCGIPSCTWDRVHHSHSLLAAGGKTGSRGT